MSSTKTAIAVGLGVVAAGTVYVLVHEKRRAIKKLAKQLQDEPISKDTLLKILNKSAEHSKAILERVHASPTQPLPSCQLHGASPSALLHSTPCLRVLIVPARGAFFVASREVICGSPCAHLAPTLRPPCAHLAPTLRPPSALRSSPRWRRSSRLAR